jgi:hypothetical protein
LPEPIHSRTIDGKIGALHPSVLDRHSQNVARSFYRRALIAAILHAMGNGCKRLLLWRVAVMDEAIRSATIIAAARLIMLMSGLFLALVPMSVQSAESLQE